MGMWSRLNLLGQLKKKNANLAIGIVIWHAWRLILMVDAYEARRNH